VATLAVHFVLLVAFAVPVVAQYCALPRLCCLVLMGEPSFNEGLASAVKLRAAARPRRRSDGGKIGDKPLWQKSFPGCRLPSD
jgi:hypothetical protein